MKWLGILDLALIEAYSEWGVLIWRNSTRGRGFEDFAFQGCPLQRWSKAAWQQETCAVVMRPSACQRRVRMRVFVDAQGHTFEEVEKWLRIILSMGNELIGWQVSWAISATDGDLSIPPNSSRSLSRLIYRKSPISIKSPCGLILSPEMKPEHMILNNVQTRVLGSLLRSHRLWTFHSATSIEHICSFRILL